jgi:hypothetical protein
MSVATSPGQAELTLKPLPSSSVERIRVMALSAAFDGVEVGLHAGHAEVGADPRVVDEHVEAARIVRHRRGGPLDRGRIGDVELQRRPPISSATPRALSSSRAVTITS